MRREQHKRFTMRLLEVKRDGANGLGFECVRPIGGVGKVPRQVDRHLAGIVKRATQRQGLSPIESQPRRDEIELGRRADAQRGGGQHAGRDRLEQQLSQAGGDVQGGRRQPHFEPRLLFDLNPVHTALCSS